VRLSLDAQHFGGRRALLRLIWETLRLRSGTRLRDIDRRKVQRLVFVCKGNICRSAFAAELARGRGWFATSAGLEADPGVPADLQASACARRRGLDLAAHRAQLFDRLELRSGDLLVAFEPAHVAQLSNRAGARDGVQITLLGLWCTPVRWAYLHDPYGLSPAYFDACFDRIERGLKGLGDPGRG
jgi:protein-tyrosine phosphatase